LSVLPITSCSFVIKADDAAREKYQEITGEKIPQVKKRKSDIRKPILPGDLWYRKESPF
jgi:hypothetical protein